MRNANYRQVGKSLQSKASKRLRYRLTVKEPSQSGRNFKVEQMGS